MTVEYLNFGGCERLQAGRKVTVFTLRYLQWMTIRGLEGKLEKSIKVYEVRLRNFR